MFDELAAQIKARTDQATAAALEMAVTLRAYNRALIDQGFTAQEAMELTRDFQRTALTQGMNPNGKSQP